MSDPIIYAVVHHWGLALFGLSAFALGLGGWVTFNHGKGPKIGLVAAIIGVILWIDFLVRVVPQ